MKQEDKNVIVTLAPPLPSLISGKQKIDWMSFGKQSEMSFGI